MKKITLLLFIFSFIGTVSFSQTTETFETETTNSTTFTDNGQSFTINDLEPGSGNYDIEEFSGAGWNGSGTDNKFIDNSTGIVEGLDGSSFSITTTDGANITVKSFYLFVSTRNLSVASTTVTITGKKDGSNVFTFSKSSGFANPQTFTPNNGFTFIDLATEGGANNAILEVDELIISSTGNADYLALDAFRWDVGTVCIDPTVPTITQTPATICVGGTASLNISGSLNDATAWHIYTGSCGGTQIGTTSTGTFAIPGTISSPTTYYVRGEGGCVTPGSCSTITITPQTQDDASFVYGSASYCVNNPDPTPTITGLGGGSFSSTAGLSINSSTGTIDVSASTPGTYTVTYTTSGTCPNSSNVSVTINALDDASFSYSVAAFCANDVDPTPTITGLGGGTFSSTAGLSINASTGAIDVSASTPNSYIVTYTTSGTCPNTSNVIVTVNALDDASFNYSASAFCVNDADPTPTITGLGGGSFSSTAGLSINASTGAIDVSASTPGTYTVTYTTSGTCPNSSTQSITINNLDDASFSYGSNAYDNDEVDPTPTISGLSGGTFSSTAGLSINASTGTIDLSASTPGTYTVTYTTNGSCPNSSTFSVTVNLGAPTFSTSSIIDGSVSVGISSNIVLTFNENIAFGTGNIQVIDVTDGSNSFIIDAASPGAQAAINGATLTINPSSDLDYNSNYAVQIATTAITDIAGNSFAGITDNTSLDFTTELTSGTGTHLNFDGTDDIVDMGSSMASVLDDINTFTVEARVRTTTTAATGVIAGIYDYPSTGGGMQFLLRRDGANYTFWIDHGTGFRNVTATSAVTTNVWQHVAGTWDGTNMKIYVDGVLVNTVAEAASSFRTLTGVNLAIGSNAHAENFTGDIDEVRIWSKARTVGEILANKDGEISNTETDLLAYYQFNQGTGEENNASVTKLTDNSVNNYTGSLTNFALSGISSNWLSPALIWTGSTNNDWDTAGNWNKNVLANSNSTITIPSGLTNYPTASSAVSVNSVSIASGATLIATSTFTTTTSATYSRSLTGSRWYYLSSPVIGETYDATWAMANSIATGSTSSSNYGVSTYNATLNDPTTGSWTYLQTDNSNNGTFNDSQGYGIYRSTTGDVSFTGSGIYNSTQSFPLDGPNNYTLIGNPFSAFISIGDLFTDNIALDEVDSDLYFWNGSSYITRSSFADASFEIAPGQGFFAKPMGNGMNFQFNYSRVSHNATDTFQKTANSRPEIHLTVNDGSRDALARVLYIDGTTKGFDAGYDGKLFGGVTHSFAIYSDLIETNGEKYQTQSLPNKEHESMIIPIGVIADAGKEITFTAETLNIPNGLNVYIEDRENNTFKQLNQEEASYKVALSAKLNGTGRFYLHTASKVLSTPSEILNSVSIYKTDINNLRIAGLHNGEATVKIYTVLGKKVVAKSFLADGPKNIALPNLASGVYLVKLKTKSGKLNKKIIIE